MWGRWGSSPGADSKMLRKASGDRELYISRVVNGPKNRETVPCVSLLPRSMVSLALFKFEVRSLALFSPPMRVAMRKRSLLERLRGVPLPCLHHE